MKWIIKVFVVFFCSGIVWGQMDKKLKKVIWHSVVYAEVQDGEYSRVPDGELVVYPSLTRKDDTTGISNQTEFLMFRDDLVNREGELFKLIRQSYVTNAEYDHFLNWVRDSITLELIYENSDPTAQNEISFEALANMLDHSDVYFNPETEQMEEFDPSKTKLNRELFNFNYQTRGISEEQIIPLIAHMYLPPHERFYGLKEWDERKLTYSEFDSRNTIAVAPEHEIWAKNSNYIFDYSYVLAKNYSRSEESEFMPATGLLGTQVNAFLDFEEWQLQKRIDEKGLPYEVHLSLPNPEEIALTDTADCNCSLVKVFEEIDMTDHWKITNEDYWEFVLAVQDSILRELIYQNNDNKLKLEELSEMLKHESIYYDEANLFWAEFDPSQPYINRSLFHFDYDFDWQKEFSLGQYTPLIKDLFESSSSNSEKGLIDLKAFKKEYNFYRYYWKDLKEQAQPREFDWIEDYQMYESKDYRAKNLSYDYRSGNTDSSGVRLQEDLSAFIVQETINVYPGAFCRNCNAKCSHNLDHFYTQEKIDSICGRCKEGWDNAIPDYDFWSEPDQLIQTINYEQALAYYNWKYHRTPSAHKSKSKYINDLVPSNTQFKKVQAGESVVLPRTEIPYPSPVFRYVIHFFPKN